LTLLFVVAAKTDLRAQGQAESKTTPQVAAPAPSCHGTQKSRLVAELLFGRDIGHRLGVSESAFARFVAHEITPRFPDGLTISDATGQWRDGSSAVIREPSKRVEIVLPGAADDEAKLGAIVAAYERRFHQQSVVVILRPACVSF
jgi:hypothetical protein